MDLYIVNAVQEEVGLRGAEMIARRIKPDVAIITDVTHDTATPMVNKLVEGDIACGKGPSLAFGPAVHNKLLVLCAGYCRQKKHPGPTPGCFPQYGNRYRFFCLCQ